MINRTSTLTDTFQPSSKTLSSPPGGVSRLTIAALVSRAHRPRASAPERAGCVSPDSNLRAAARFSAADDKVFLSPAPLRSAIHQSDSVPLLRLSYANPFAATAHASVARLDRPLSGHWQSIRSACRSLRICAVRRLLPAS